MVDYPSLPSQVGFLWLNCLIEKESIVFPVNVVHDLGVGELKTVIKTERALDIFKDPHILELWKVSIDLDSHDRPPLSDIKVDNIEGANKLEGWNFIFQYWAEQPPVNCLHIIVKKPSTSLSEMHLTDINRPEFTIKLRTHRNWHYLSVNDLAYNNVKCTSAQAQYLRDFQKRLQHKRHISAHEMLRQFRIPKTMDTHFDVSPDPNITDLDFVTELELLHYQNIFSNPESSDMANYGMCKEPQIYALLQLSLTKLKTIPSHSWGYGTRLPFRLMIQLDGCDERLSYSPQSDFHMCIRDFPHVLFEVNSQRNEGDQIRLLLQASCIARIDNWLRASTSGKQIVIMAIYIDKQFRAHQHLLYQPDIKSTTVVVVLNWLTGSLWLMQYFKVEYITRIFKLTVCEDAFEFIFQLYNFLSVAKADNDGFHEPEVQLAEAKDSVERKKYATFTAKRKRDSSNRNSDSSRDPPSHGSRDIFNNPSVQRELTSAGYTLTLPISDEITLLTPIKPTMCQATSRSDVRVVLKTIFDSNERRMLEHLSVIKSPLNHTIPLLDIIELSIGKTIIVLPWKSPLDEVLQFRDCPDDVVSLCLQFIEGVGFLHQHKVAHCDLKPGNVVVDTKSGLRRSAQLFIIDFGLALSVESEETMTKGWCGTPPWIAPELGSRDGPMQRYSPMLADRWACGQMVKYFTKYFPIYEGTAKAALLTFAQQLLDLNPRTRPELDRLRIMHGPTK